MKIIYSILIVVLTWTAVSAQTCNLNFESGIFSGWTITKGSPSLSNNDLMSSCCATPGSTAVAVLSTPFSDPYLGTVPQSPLGGSFVARVNNQNTDGNASRITNTFAVGTNTLFQFAVAAVVDGITEPCSSVAYAHVRLLNGGSPFYSVHHVPMGVNTASCSSSAFTNTVNFTAFFCWQTYTVDLSAYVGTNITVEVTASNCGGWGHWAYCYFDAACSAVTPTTVSCSMTTGIKEIVEVAPVQVWPSPVKDELHVTIQSQVNSGEIIIWDILGHVVLRQPVKENNTLSLQHLPAGTYVYQVKYNDDVKTGKFVKE